MFLRGHGSQNYIQYNGSITGNTTTSHASANLGIIQGDAERNLYGVAYPTISPGGGGAILSNPSATYGAFRIGHHSPTCFAVPVKNSVASEGDAGFVFENTRQVPVANEIRPVNIAVKYLIRVSN